MTASLKDLAIQCALHNDWKQATLLNKQLLSENPNDLESLNRLAFAYMQLGEYTKAKTTYKKVISLDKTNPIAVKNLSKLDTVSKQKQGSQLIRANVDIGKLYIEEAGKTKTIELKNLTDKKTLSYFQPGDEVHLVIKRSKIFVQSTNDQFIGMLPEDIGTRLINFIKGGNEYMAHIKSIGEKNVTIFMKEVKKSSRFKNQPSFPTSYAHASLDD